MTSELGGEHPRAKAVLPCLTCTSLSPCACLEPKLGTPGSVVRLPRARAIPTSLTSSQLSPCACLEPKLGLQGWVVSSKGQGSSALCYLHLTDCMGLSGAKAGIQGRVVRPPRAREALTCIIGTLLSSCACLQHKLGLSGWVGASQVLRQLTLALPASH